MPTIPPYYREAYLKWDDPRAKEVIDKWIVEAKQSGQDFVRVDEVTNPRSDCVTWNLDPGDYTLSVQAVNETGTSDRATIDIIIFEPEIPPTDLQVTGLTLVINGRVYRLVEDIETPANEVIVDEVDGEATGNWLTSTGKNPYGQGSLYANEEGAIFEWRANLSPGKYRLEAWWTEYRNRVAATYEIAASDGIHTVTADQKSNGGQWNSLGTYDFQTFGSVILHSPGNGTVCADAVRWVPV